MKLALHIGAHKTATTYIQETLALNASRLASGSIYYLPLNETRSLITSAIDLRSERLGDELNRLRSLKYDRIVLSDENFIGVPQSLLKTGALYPQIEERTRLFLEYFDDIEVYFCLRSYDNFWPSLYCEMIRHQAFFDWGEFLSHFSVLDTSWKAPVSSLVKVLGEERLILWDYRTFRESEDRLFEKLLGSNYSLNKAGQHVRESPSNKAMKLIALLRTNLSDPEIRRLVWPISKAFPKDANNGPFRPFTEQMETRLNIKFTNDMFDIREQYPKMQWL